MLVMLCIRVSEGMGCPVEVWTVCKIPRTSEDLSCIFSCATFSMLSGGHPRILHECPFPDN